jgi:transcriptional regulator with XRE-family HTH domain
MKADRSLVSAIRFSELLKKYRKRAKKSFNKLAIDIGVDPSYISRIEIGDRRPPKREIVIKLGRSLGLDATEIDDFLIAANYAPIYPEDVMENYAGLKVIENHPTLKLLAEMVQGGDVDSTDIELIDSIIKNIKKRKNNS